MLAAIEEDLRTADPTLACHLAHRRAEAGDRWRAAFRHGALLIAALIILIIAALMIPPGWWAGLGLLTSLLLVPWILLFPTDHPHQD